LKAALKSSSLAIKAAAGVDGILLQNIYYLFISDYICAL
jgi:hypothetical protein